MRLPFHRLLLLFLVLLFVGCQEEPDVIPAANTAEPTLAEPVEAPTITAESPPAKPETATISSCSIAKNTAAARLEMPILP